MGYRLENVCAKNVPKNLTAGQKANQRDVLISCIALRGRQLFSRVITCDELWVLEYNPVTKCQSGEWHTANSPHPKQVRKRKSKIKSILFSFFLFDSQGIVPK
jgi:hypothetical protein